MVMKSVSIFLLSYSTYILTMYLLLGEEVLDEREALVRIAAPLIFSTLVTSFTIKE